MSCANAVFVTKGTPLTATAVVVVPYNIHRKGLLISANGGEAKFAVGETPTDADYITLKDGDHIFFDSLIPVAAVWAKGAGTLVVGEAA